MQNTLESVLEFIFDDNISIEEYPCSEDTLMRAMEFKENYMLHQEIKNQKVGILNSIVNPYRSSKYEEKLFSAKTYNGYSINYRNYKMV